MTKKQDAQNQKFVEDIVASVLHDFRNRQQARKNYERQWQLNMNFLGGNQYCGITSMGEVEDFQKQFFWQEREVYNHIAPILEQRKSRLGTIRPKMNVVPATNSENDLNTAKVSKNILNAVYYKLGMSDLIAQATNWSEICGTSFYKVTWDSNGGLTVGHDEHGNEIKEGEIKIVVCPPYEIFPDNSNAENIDDCMSIIHAKCYDVRTIKSIWGVDVNPTSLDVMTLDNVSSTIGGLGYNSQIAKVISQKVDNCALVIEKYEAPTVDYPNGRLTIVAGDKLVFIGDLPYINKDDKKRGFPFIKQCSIVEANRFWGTSIIERLIPIQRAYNAVKNRKHEFMNRMAMGILTVEDGSVDTENLEEEGMSPGKVLVYRQGANKPEIMNSGSMPTDFEKEEERLLAEFASISGVSEMMISQDITSSNISGVALEILVEQENNRLSNSADQIKSAVKILGKQILKLYKQYALSTRICKIIGQDGSVEMFYFKGSEIGADDVVLETANEIGDTLAQKRNMIFKLLEAGLLADENGKISNRVRSKTLEMLGYGIWETQNDISELHMRKAGKENLVMLGGASQEVLEIDDHKLHIDEHIAFMLGSEYEKMIKRNPSIKQVFLNHINQHKKLMPKGE